VAAELAARGAAVEFDVVSNPEFLKEGDAVEDCLRPDRIVIGSSSARAVALLRKLYAPFNRNHERIVVMDERSAELTKYAANAMLATKISFMNEIANIAERVGADVELVRQGIGSDPRIGYHFIYPGAGYGGSCFPKDVQALERTARAAGYRAQLLGAVEGVNERQKTRLFELIQGHFGGDLAGRTVALWGLAFKPNTDDMREASSRKLMEALWEAGARVRAYDPEAREETRRIYGERPDLVLCEQPYQALEGADVLAIVTEWKAFRSPDFARIRGLLAEPAIFDGRNLYDPGAVEEAGLAYYGIGRGRSLKR
jgi:UDPglucose 6-dehydrogenase